MRLIKYFTLDIISEKDVLIHLSLSFFSGCDSKKKLKKNVLSACMLLANFLSIFCNL
jgi:hypothetical protein